MVAKLPIPTQRKILKLEQRIFRLEQHIARLKAKHEKAIAKLQAENQNLRDQPIVITEEQRAKLIEQRKRLLAAIDPKT